MDTSPQAMKDMLARMMQEGMKPPDLNWPLLLRQLRTKKVSTRLRALRTLIRVHVMPEPPQAPPEILFALTEAFNDRDLQVRSLAANVHFYLMPHDDTAIHFLAEQLRNATDILTLSSTLEIVARMKTRGRIALPECVQLMLHHEHAGIRSEAAVTLRDMGPAAEPAVPDLAHSLRNDADADVRAMAAMALGQIGAPAAAAVSDLANACDDSDYEVQYMACDALSKIGPTARAVLSALASALIRREKEAGETAYLKAAQVRCVAARTIARIGTQDTQFMSVLIEALRDEDEGVFTWAAEALGQLGPAAKPALDALEIAAGRAKILSNKKSIMEAAAKIRQIH